MTYNEKINKLVEVFSEYYKTYDGTFDEEFLCGGYAKVKDPNSTKKTISDKFDFHKTLQVQDWMKLIKYVAATDYNFYDKDLNHYGFRNFTDYENKKKEIEETIGLYEM